MRSLIILLSWFDFLLRFGIQDFDIIVILCAESILNEVHGGLLAGIELFGKFEDGSVKIGVPNAFLMVFTLNMLKMIIRNTFK